MTATYAGVLPCYIANLTTCNVVVPTFIQCYRGGGGYDSVLLNAIKAHGDNGMLFVAAAGNAGTNTDVSPQYPAGYNLDNIISVGSITSTGAVSSFSNYGATTVDLFAPGSSIYSTWPDNTYTTISGTSASWKPCAFVIVPRLMC